MSTSKIDTSPAHCLALQRLRETTRRHHEALESALQLEKIQTDRLRYTQLICRLHGLYRVLETDANFCVGLSRWQSEMQQVGLVWPERKKLPSLHSDLAALGALPSSAQGDCAPRVIASNFSQVLGCLYVVEGSTLGGQIICRRLRSQLGLTAETGLAFFTGYGPRTGAMWRQMCAVLSTQLIAPEKLDAAVLAAQQTFVLFQSWLAP